MRSYLVVKALALSLGAVSVVARSLPEHRSEIKNRADGGGHRLSNPLTELEAADAKIDTAASNPTTNIDDLKHRLEGMGLVMISEGMLDEKVYTAKYSIPASTNFSMPGTALEKRDRNVEGGRCSTFCFRSPNPNPNTDDCTTVYRSLYEQAIQFSVGPFELALKTHEDCAAWFINNTGDTVVYDYWDFGGTTEYLTGKCITKDEAQFGGCVFGAKSESSPFIAVTHPSYSGPPLRSP